MALSNMVMSSEAFFRKIYVIGNTERSHFEFRHVVMVLYMWFLSFFFKATILFFLFLQRA